MQTCKCAKGDTIANLPEQIRINIGIMIVWETIKENCKWRKVLKITNRKKIKYRLRL